MVLLVDVYTWSMLRHAWGGCGMIQRALLVVTWSMLHNCDVGGCVYVVDATAMLGVLWDEYMLPCMITCTVGFGGVHIFLMMNVNECMTKLGHLAIQQATNSSKAARCCSPCKIFQNDNSDKPLMARNHVFVQSSHRPRKYQAEAFYFPPSSLRASTAMFAQSLF